MGNWRPTWSVCEAGRNSVMTTLFIAIPYMAVISVIVLFIVIFLLVVTPIIEVLTTLIKKLL